MPAKKEEKKEPKKPAPPEKKQEPPAVDAQEVAALADALLRQLNTYRKTAGLELVWLDPELSRGCTAHARYLALNPPAKGDAARCSTRSRTTRASAKRYGERLWALR